MNILRQYITSTNVLLKHHLKYICNNLFFWFTNSPFFFSHKLCFTSILEAKQFHSVQEIYSEEKYKGIYKRIGKFVRLLTLGDFIFHIISILCQYLIMLHRFLAVHESVFFLKSKQRNCFKIIFSNLILKDIYIFLARISIIKKKILKCFLANCISSLINCLPMPFIDCLLGWFLFSKFISSLYIKYVCF